MIDVAHLSTRYGGTLAVDDLDVVAQASTNAAVFVRSERSGALAGAWQ